MTTDLKAAAAQVLRLVSASVGLASAPMKAGPYSWIGTLAQASTTAAADILDAPSIDTAQGKQAIGFALASVFDALPQVSRAQSEDLAAGIVAAVRIIRKWST